MHFLREKLYFLMEVSGIFQGYTPGCDYYTKEFAMLLTSQLDAPLLYAEGLRLLVDLN